MWYFNENWLVNVVAHFFLNFHNKASLMSFSSKKRRERKKKPYQSGS